MKQSTTKILYWVFTIIFVLFMLMDGFGGITKQAEGIKVMNELGYPIYLVQILGTAKLMGAAAILQNKYYAIKEWAYAGFAFNFIGAFASRAFVHSEAIWIILPLIMLAVMFIPYFLWKKMQRIKTGKSTIARTASVAV